jgi:hypothetical protein
VFRLLREFDRRRALELRFDRELQRDRELLERRLRERSCGLVRERELRLPVELRREPDGDREEADLARG